RHFTGHGTARRRQRHLDQNVAVVGHIDLVDQAQLIDVDRNFRVVHRLQRLDQVVGQLVQLSLRQGALLRLVPAGGEGVAVADGGFGLGVVHTHHTKKFRALISASTKASVSSTVLYRAKEARVLEVTPSLFASGSAQCRPARTATPYRSMIWATS